MDRDSEAVRVLFVCRLNQRRSATAERVFCKDPSLDVRSAGTDPDARVRINGRMLEWADVVFVMDHAQTDALTRQFAGHAGLAKIVCLEIEDKYLFLDPELVELLRTRVPPHIVALKRT
jgi:predicted protein tyrosine phosphatase